MNAALFPSSREESLAVPRASFALSVCETCGLLFNAEHDETLAEYSTSCIETPTCSPHHRAFATALARDWVDRHELDGQPVVEVGCGHKAEFLRSLVDLGISMGTCVDPACDAQPSEVLRIYRERFTADHATLPGRALVCRHTLEHVPLVQDFLRDVRAWSRRNGDAIVLFEVPDASRILEQRAFWDVYYEHCCYFTRGALEAAFRAVGLDPECVELVYDDQYLVLEARPGPVVAPEPSTARPVVDAAVAFANVTGDRIRRAARSLRELAADGTVVLWQAGGKALSLLTLTETTGLVAGAVDANPDKHGRFLPGTSVRILSPEDLRATMPRHVVVMNEVYLAEIGASLDALGVDASLQSIEMLLDRG